MKLMYDQTKKSSAVHNICKFMSIKNDEVICTMSMLEFDFCFHAEYNPNVLSFQSQPDGFKYLFNGRTCRYTPDFELVDSDKNPTLVEVKHSSQINKPEFRARFKAKQHYAISELNTKLILVTDQQIRNGFLLSNLKLLHAYSGLRTVTSIQKQILKFIQKNRTVQLTDISNEFNISSDEACTAVLCWLATGNVQTNLKDKQFDLDSYVWC